MVNNKKDKFNIDTMDFKSHLDTSFDIDNIRVSEELITKTLMAIKDSEKQAIKSENTLDEEFMNQINDNETDTDSKKIKFRFSYMNVATVAAAVLIFVVGMYAMNNGVSTKDSGNGMHKEQSTDNTSNSISEDTEYGIATEENARVDVTGSNKDENKMEDYDIKADQENDEMSSAEFAKVSATTISSLYPIEFTATSELTIKDVNSVIVCGTNQVEKVKELYTILDKYPMIETEITTLEYIYQFDILTDAGQSYTILIGSGIYVKTLDELEYTYYEIDNKDALLVELENFISTIP